ncbi:MAG: ABC transporter permease [Planctomycetota bacterium]|jgi:putative ABC transport system permease protein
MRWFGIKRTVKLGVKSLWMHRLRSTLTTLGIVFGVCSVIAMLAIGEGASRETQEAIARLGSTNLIIETVEPPQKQADSGEVETVRNYGLTYNDAESIRNTIPDVEVAVPIREVDQQARYLNRRAAIKIVGTIPWYTEIAPIRMIRGRFLSSIDLHHQQSVCVVDENVARALFAFDDPMSQHVRIQGSFYRVVGISAPFSSVNDGKGFGSDMTALASPGTGAMGTIYVPLTTAKVRFGELLFSLSGGSRSASKVELQKITVKVNPKDRMLGLKDMLAMRDTLDVLLDRLHDKEDYRIVVPLELLLQAARTKRIFNIVLGSIAAISLLVGGIGIMNIMLASVSERTREIGVRRALGARKCDIIIQFLSETVMLTLMGGFLGIILGVIIPYAVTKFADMPTVITPVSLILAFGISATVGIIFGLYPAHRAANMDPIESLRHE